jgi:hypothetical protein
LRTRYGWPAGTDYFDSDLAESKCKAKAVTVISCA